MRLPIALPLLLELWTREADAETEVARTLWRGAKGLAADAKASPRRVVHALVAPRAAMVALVFVLDRVGAFEKNGVPLDLFSQLHFFFWIPTTNPHAGALVTQHFLGAGASFRPRQTEPPFTDGPLTIGEAAATHPAGP